MHGSTILTTLLLFTIPCASAAQVVPEAQTAYQPLNASALSGPIILSRDRILFSTGAASTLEAIEVEGVEGEIFRLDDPVAALRDGRTICSAGPIEYLVATLNAGSQRDTLQLAFHASGDTPPAAKLCAVYQYTGPDSWMPTSLDDGRESLEDDAAAAIADAEAEAAADAMAAAAAGATVDTAPDVPTTGDWRTEASINPLDDSKTVFISLKAESGRSRWGTPVEFVARCQSGQTEAYVIWHDYLGNDGSSSGGEYKNVTVRIGEDPAQTQKWSISTDKEANFAPYPSISMLQKMVKSKRLVLQTTPYNENPITAVFDLTGLDVALKEVSDTCAWNDGQGGAWP